MNVCISTEAQDDLLAVWEFSRSRWGTAQADLYLDQLLLRMVWLKSNQGLWRHRPDLGIGFHCYPEQRHVIFFSEISKKIAILRVLDSRMDTTNILP